MRKLIARLSLLPNYTPFDSTIGSVRRNLIGSPVSKSWSFVSRTNIHLSFPCPLSQPNFITSFLCWQRVMNQIPVLNVLCHSDSRKDKFVYCLHQRSFEYHLSNQPTASRSQHLNWEKLVTNTIFSTHYMEQCIHVNWSRAGQRTEWPVLINDIDLFRIGWNRIKFAQ